MKKTSLLFILIMIIPLGACKKKEPTNYTGKVVFINGKVTVDGKNANLNQVVKEGSKIVTSPNSFCDIIFNTKNIMRITPNSSIELNITEEKSSINVEKGALMSVFYRLVNAGEGAFEISTPTAVASIRGTTFYIKVEDKNNTYFCDCNGKIEISGSDGKVKQAIEATHHKAVRLTKGDDGIKLSSAGLKYHNDREMNKISQKIGVEIDWTKIDEE